MPDIEALVDSTSRAPALRPKGPELRDAARQFEGILMQQMLRFADQPITGERMLDGGPGGRMYRELFLEHVAQLATERGGFGIARMLESELAGRRAESREASGGQR